VLVYSLYDLVCVVSEIKEFSKRRFGSAGESPTVKMWNWSHSLWHNYRVRTGVGKWVGRWINISIHFSICTLGNLSDAFLKLMQGLIILLSIIWSWGMIVKSGNFDNIPFWLIRVGSVIVLSKGIIRDWGWRFGVGGFVRSWHLLLISWSVINFVNPLLLLICPVYRLGIVIRNTSHFRCLSNGVVVLVD